MKACNYTLYNTGSGCTPLIQALKKLIIVPIFDATGAKNRIDLTVSLNDAYFAALVNQADATKRWYPLPFMKDADPNRGENIVEGFKDGSQIFIQQGAKTFTAVIVEKDAPPRLLIALESFRNIDFGLYGIDKDNNLVGMKNAAGYLEPIRIDASSWAPKFIEATDTTSQKIALNFNWHINEKDKNIDMIAESELVAGTDIANLDGLLDVYADASAITTTGCTLSLYTLFGTQKNPVRDTGRVIADFISSITAATSKIRNQTDSADVTLTTVTETATPGIYTLVWPAQTSADVLIPFLTKSGRDYQHVKEETITIP